MIADARSTSEPLAVVLRLQGAMNAHDLDGLTACFAEEYRSEIPLHPSRSFQGADQVRRNWAVILAGVPDLHAELIRSVTAGDTVWAEWQWTGTRRDGVPHLMRGTTIVGTRDGRIAWTRFYMEPVVEDGLPIDTAVQASVASDARDTAR
jgi:ketosteroid isomerase-like protein